MTIGVLNDYMGNVNLKLGSHNDLNHGLHMNLQMHTESSVNIETRKCACPALNGDFG